MYNKVIFIGNLTRDAELQYLPSSLAISQFNLAVNTKYGEKEEVLFIDNVLFGKLAEALQKYLTKGTQILVEGRLQEQKWEKEGEKRQRYVVVVNNIRLLHAGTKDTGAKEAKKQEPKEKELEPF